MAKPTFALSRYGPCGGFLVRVLRGMLGIYHVTSGSLGRFVGGFNVLSAAGAGLEPIRLPRRLSPALRPTRAWIGFRVISGCDRSDNAAKTLRL